MAADTVLTKILVGAPILTAPPPASLAIHSSPARVSGESDRPSIVLTAYHNSVDGGFAYTTFDKCIQIDTCEVVAPREPATAKFNSINMTHPLCVYRKMDCKGCEPRGSVAMLGNNDPEFRLSRKFVWILSCRTCNISTKLRGQQKSTQQLLRYDLTLNLLTDENSNH
eukprot:5644667-Pleurochrysis_carterae.AAC.2